ncbi:hypothetical protein [Niveispirillum sp. KHB5.9]|uniref:hypothetical protein n=1 Tax=Niveispirillum sp. KHB5.9 TaxID=3400269 RepID=UPI003A85A3D8
MTTQPDPNLVPKLIRTAFVSAGNHASGREDLTAAAVAGLRKLRRVLAEQAGDSATQQVMDGPVNAYILDRNLKEFARTGVEPVPAPLPPDLALVGPAAAVMLDAVENGLIVHKFTQGNGALTLMVPELMACLCATLDGTPEAGALLALLRRGTAENGEPGIQLDGPPPSQRLH